MTKSPSTRPRIFDDVDETTGGNAEIRGPAASAAPPAENPIPNAKTAAPIILLIFFMFLPLSNNLCGILPHIYRQPSIKQQTNNP